jgi:hypothetical protein
MGNLEVRWNIPLRQSASVKPTPVKQPLAKYRSCTYENCKLYGNVLDPTSVLEIKTKTSGHQVFKEKKGLKPREDLTVDFSKISKRQKFRPE